MKKIDWARKLSSRKFWALAAGLATSVLVLAKVDENTTAQVVAVMGPLDLSWPTCWPRHMWMGRRWEVRMRRTDDRAQ